VGQRAPDGARAVKTAAFLDEQGDVDVSYPISKFKSLEEYIPSIANLMKVKSIETGVIISSNGENIILINENGEVINKEKYLILVSLISIKYGKCKKLIIPYTTTNVIESIGKKYNVEIVRTKSNDAFVMNELLSSCDNSNDFLI
jgi:mannose-1-phosphate guanylyltransferase/phosphomannomutase